jgi:acyl-CoA thioesterase I
MRTAKLAFLAPVFIFPLMDAALHSSPSRNACGEQRQAPFRVFLTICAIFAVFDLEPARPTRLVAFGDSLTAGYGLQPKEAFPAVLGARLRADGYDVKAMNAGVSGDTTQGGLSRLSGVEALRPDLVILELGANDMLNGFDPELTEANLEEMILRLRSKGAYVLLAGMRARSDALDETERARFDALFPSLAARHALPLYPNFLEDVVDDGHLVLWGGLHPNRDGVRIIVDRIAPLVERTLDELEVEQVAADRRNGAVSTGK